MAKNRRSAGMRSRKKRPQQLVIGVVTLLAVLVVGIFVVANWKTTEAAYYKYVTPIQLEQVIKGNEPVLVYFHSPT